MIKSIRALTKTVGAACWFILFVLFAASSMPSAIAQVSPCTGGKVPNFLLRTFLQSTPVYRNATSKSPVVGYLPANRSYISNEWHPGDGGDKVWDASRRAYDSRFDYLPAVNAWISNAQAAGDPPNSSAAVPSYCNASTQPPQAPSNNNPRLAFDIIFDNNFPTALRPAIEKGFQNWSRMIPHDMVNYGPIKVYVKAGAMQVGGRYHWAETSIPTTPESPRTRYRRSDGYFGVMTFNSSAINSLNNNQLVRLATHEVGHLLNLNEAENDRSLGTDGIMQSVNLPMNVSEGVYLKLEGYGYTVDRNRALVTWN
jgi:hypothetical protein